MVGQLFSQSTLTEAINYALNHWDGLTMFLSDGRVEVDSNTVERSMRPIAMGRRNSLFSGSEGGAESWAILASVVNTAKLNGLDPQTYLGDVVIKRSDDGGWYTTAPFSSVSRRHSFVGTSSTPPYWLLSTRNFDTLIKSL